MLLRSEVDHAVQFDSGRDEMRKSFQFHQQERSWILFLCCWLSAVTFISALSAENNYISVFRNNLQYGTMISIQPHERLWRMAKVASGGLGSMQITDIVYIPSALDKEGNNPVDSAVDDEHFSSILCDKGFNVHTLIPKSAKDSRSILHEAISELIGRGQSLKGKSQTTQLYRKLCARNIAIIGCELSCGHLLSYLTACALPMTSDRIDIGAVTLIDSPPLQTMLTTSGRRRILNRYLEPLTAHSHILDEYLMSKRNPSEQLPKKKRVKSWRKRIELKEKESENEAWYWQRFMRSSFDESTTSGQIEKYIHYLESRRPEGNQLLEIIKEERIAQKAAVSKPLLSSALFIEKGGDFVLNSSTYSSPSLVESWLSSADQVAYQQVSFSKDMESRLWKLRRKQDVYKTNKELDEENMLESLMIQHNQTVAKYKMNNVDDLALSLVGKYPVQIRETALAMKNRILLIASDNIARKSEVVNDSTVSAQFFDEKDEWGYEAVEEVAAMFDAGPVIYTEDISIDDLGLEEKQRKELTSMKVETDDLKDNFALRHLKLATIISDWLNMLPQFNYL